MSMRMTPIPALRVAGLALAILATLAHSAPAAEVIERTGETLRLEINKGRLVRLERPASTVFIANPEVADIQVKSPTLIYLMGRAPGETTLYAVDERERILAELEILVTHNLERLRRAVSDLHPSAEVRVSSVDGAVVLDGVVASASVAADVRRLAARIAGTDEQVINRLAVDAQSQVNLRVRVVEVSRGVDKQLGFNWTAVGALGGLSIGFATSNPFAANLVTNTLSISGSTSKWDVNAIVDALEGEGLITVLAEPNLTALSGETASFLAGGEFPILVPEGDDRIVIEFKKFGVSLSFTPTLAAGDRINLHVRPEVSQLSNEGAVSVPIAGTAISVPALTTRRAETTVELGSGQSFAIAGLLENKVTHDISKFPGLGDIPVLGGFFRSDRFQRNESELVIIVTPYIVRPVSKAGLMTPVDGFAPPNDIERFVIGGTHRQNREVGARRAVTHDGSTLIGPVGFTLD
jgi:pilus assembly protein CpaC